jgi:hypothetical protein
MIKWKLMFSTLPYVAAVLALKLGAEKFFGFNGVLEFSDIALVLTGGVFLIGFMLSGTLTDFKEAEKIPAEVACVLETLEEMFLQASVGRSFDLAAQRQAVLETGESIWFWLHRKVKQEAVFAQLAKLASMMLELEKAGAGPHATRGLRELHNLRRHVTRVGVISRTGFVAAGYALLEVLTAAILGMTVVSHFKNALTEVVLVSFITLIFVYMVRMIRDIDDPFEYDETGQVGAVEVELFPISEYLDRLRNSLKK